ncbi:hypothetical protein Tco_1558230, partial [Tanacetum coccineum]
MVDQVEGKREANSGKEKMYREEVMDA